MGLRRMNLFGEVDGLCRIANTDVRIDKLMQACQISATSEALGMRRQEEAEFKKQVKQVAAAATAERRRITSEKKRQ